MGRSRAAPVRAGGASVSRPAAAPTPSRPHTTTNNTHSQAPHTNQSAAQPQQPQVTNVYVQRSSPMMGGGGGGSGMLGTMAAVAGGSVLGHGISNYLYGNNHNQAPPSQPAEAQELAKAAAQENHVCTPQLMGYSKCLEANPESADSCKWAWDYFQQCQQQQPSIS